MRISIFTSLTVLFIACAAAPGQHKRSCNRLECLTAAAEAGIKCAQTLIDTGKDLKDDIECAASISKGAKKIKDHKCDVCVNELKDAIKKWKSQHHKSCKRQYSWSDENSYDSDDWGSSEDCDPPISASPTGYYGGYETPHASETGLWSFAASQVAFTPPPSVVPILQPIPPAITLDVPPVRETDTSTNTQPGPDGGDGTDGDGTTVTVTTGDPDGDGGPDGGGSLCAREKKEDPYSGCPVY